MLIDHGRNRMAYCSATYTLGPFFNLSQRTLARILHGDFIRGVR